MYKKNKIVVLITARGGSKGVPKKNIKPVKDKPLIAYSIEAARSAKYVDRVIVSTDSKEIAEIAKNYGADVPFLRPAILANDTAKSIDVVLHAAEYLQKNEKYDFDVLVLVQPTSPLVLGKDIDTLIKKLIDTGMNSGITVSEVDSRPEWMYTIKNQKALPYIPERDQEQRRQDMAPLYISNGAGFAVKRTYLLKNKRLLDDKKNTAVIMPRERSLDINTPFDFVVAEALLAGTEPKNQ